MNETSDSIQNSPQGKGPLYHRHYYVDLPVRFSQAKKVMLQLQHGVNEFSPQWLATFAKRGDQKSQLSVGDEFDVKLSAPWVAPVRVVKVTDIEFELATLEGHIEAGRITFRIRSITENETRFEIESTARSKDRFINFFYDRIPIFRAAQTRMWIEFCTNFAGALNKNRSRVHIKTEKFDEETSRWKKV